MIEKLVVGTANFGQSYNNHQVPAEEIDKIWEYCREVGIEYADTAVAYNYMPPKDFKIITKIKRGGLLGQSYYGALLHYNLEDFSDDLRESWAYLVQLKEKGLLGKIGLSIYDFMQYDEFYGCGVEIIQLSYKQHKSRLQEIRDGGIEVHVRKVFADDVYEEALLDKNVDKIILGLDNLEQLQENVEIAKSLKEKDNETV